MIARQLVPQKVEQLDDALDNLLERNRNWVARKTDHDPEFFARLVGQRRPGFFWIGCSDSRVPATEIVDLDPGEMFVHRNVANIASPDDPSFAAALEFAVQTLQVDHVMVVGHYGCGGIHAAIKPAATGAVDEWLRPLRDLVAAHASTLKNLDEGTRLHRLCELNVIEQVRQLSENSIVRDAWRQERPLRIHGLVYAIGDGLLARVCGVTSGTDAALRFYGSYSDLSRKDGHP